MAVYISFYDILGRVLLLTYFQPVQSHTVDYFETHMICLHLIEEITEDCILNEMKGQF